ncbi:MAG: cyclic nucleotide-gated ion channel [Hyphomicrobiaceae bacterium]
MSADATQSAPTRREPEHGDRFARLRRRVYEVVEAGRGEDRLSTAVDTLIVALIVLNIAAFAAETVPSVGARFHREFLIFEIISVAIFTVEYLARIWVAVEMPFLSRLPAWKARLRMAQRPQLIIDLLAILPFYLAWMLTIDLRVLRILRLLRFFKLSRYSPAMHTLIRVLSNERRALMGAGLLLTGAVLFAATGMYYLESHAQPDKFGSVPDAAWWAIATLTTVGYGDVAPITPMGKVFGGMVMIIGLSVLALPVAIISTGFAQEVGRRDFVINWSLMSRIPMLAELDASAVAAIMPMLHAHNLPPNAEVVAPGTKADAIYFVASGCLKRHAPEHVHEYRTGEVFGLLPMLRQELHTHSVLTASKTRLLKLHRADFERLERLQPVLVQRLRTIAQERFSARADEET